MSRLGVIANGRSWRAAKGGAPRRPAGVPFEAPGDLNGYAPALARLKAAGVDTLAVVGGDGTLREVMSALPSAYGASPPALALAPFGKTNAAAADVGGCGHGPDALERLAGALASGVPLKRSERRPIAARFDGRAVQGFVLGFGAFERATRMVDSRVHSRGFAQRLGVAFGVAEAARELLTGREGAGWRQGVAAAVAADGAEASDDDRFFFLATSLRRFMLGLWPFWGEGEGAIAWTDVSAPPHRLASALLPAARGRATDWMRANGYRSGRANRIDVALRAPFIIDGDSFSAGADGRIAIQAGAPLTFLAP
ncbi:diacylglycerol kinase [Methylopila jiangsuensis]|uniref:Diacylglycerol kinase n=1 Tax=Methylopila jiangsuensis TaxID=586230 RepID=A0A9W6N473_9HYPH|nr:diacylglycerol kinase family protein [Methylopila jiangsuensis]MDR6286623.1 hypothetical protein [Methylopila jiangsuensis]GLK77035.1 diacylglycerol kinase [Methylopila jiangsuensis]